MTIIVLISLGHAFEFQQEILKNLHAAHSLSPPPPVLKEKRFKFSSSWFPVACSGQFALPVCKNVCMQLENFVCL